MLKIFILLIFYSLFIQFVLTQSPCIPNKNNCEVCHPLTGLCLKCISENYFPDINGGCEPKCTIGKNYCNQCSDDQKLCISCESGYFADKIGGCAFFPNCESSYKGKCLKCEEGYILIGDKNSFQICKSINTEDLKYCEEINNITGLCDKCQEGYYLGKKDLKCTETEHCSESTFGICFSCIDDYCLDKKNNKCIKDGENLIHCKETLDGINCDSCLLNYYLAEDGQCTNTLMCQMTSKGICTKCIDQFYLSEDNCCTTEEKCQYGEGSTALCNYCYSGYYLDNKDKKCKFQNEEEFKHCEVYEDGCIECEYDYFIGGDLKCTKTKNCDESFDEKCIQCKEGYYLGKDNLCSPVEHCIYSGGLFDCEECEDGFYFNVFNKTCLPSGENLKNCKIVIFDENKCSLCKDNYYLNKTDYLCYDNTNENSDFYKCDFTDYNGEKCDKCISGYSLTSGDKKCIKIRNCKYSKNENECSACDDVYCLDMKNQKCISNDYLENGEINIFISCNRTNSEGDKCEICLDGYEADENGYCRDVERCQEKDEKGVCLKCKDDISIENGYYCANEVYGCLRTIIMGCKKCNDFNNLYICTECHEGYYLNDEKKCNRY